MQVTFVSFWNPFPPDNGAKQRTLMLLEALAQEHRVDLVLLTTNPDEANLPDVISPCRSITTIPIPAFDPDAPRAWSGLFQATPRSFAARYNPAVTALLRDRRATGRCDAILCGELAARYAQDMARDLPVIIDELDPSRYLEACETSETARQRVRAALTFWKYRQFVRQSLQDCAGFFVASEREAVLLRGLVARRSCVALVPNGISSAPPNSEVRDLHRVVYSGAPTYVPNLDAATYFARDILPSVLAEIPQARFAVTGATGDAPIAHLAALPGIVFTGWLPDIRSYVASSRVCVVPLRQGGGTRLKILEAMVVGTPVVATPKGAEGLDLTNGKDILIAETAEAFADATIRLLRDDDLHARIAAHARETVIARYGWERIGAEMRTSFARLAGIVDTPVTHLAPIS